MAPFYGCRDPGTKLDGVKLAPVTAKTSKTGPRHVVLTTPALPATSSGARARACHVKGANVKKLGTAASAPALSVFSRDDVKVASAAAVRRAQLNEKGAIPTKTRREPVKMGRLT